MPSIISFFCHWPILLPAFLKCLQLLHTFFLTTGQFFCLLSRNVSNYYIHFFWYHWPILLLTFQKCLQLFHTCSAHSPIFQKFLESFFYTSSAIDPFSCLLSGIFFSFFEKTGLSMALVSALFRKRLEDCYCSVLCTKCRVWHWY